MTRQRFRRSRRAGNTLVIAVLLMIVLFAMLAFSVDLGYMLTMRSQLQRSADAAAIAAAWDLLDEDVLVGNAPYYESHEQARASADRYAGLNRVGSVSPDLAAPDVIIGVLQNPSNWSETINTGDPSHANAVHVRVRRTAEQNGEVPFFFARVLGFQSHAVRAEAAAAFWYDFRGFRAPPDGGNLGILPIALDKPTWDNLLAGDAEDDWHWDPDMERIVAGGDGILEVDLYPKDSGAPGNRGTVDIGSNDNSTSDLNRQITEGVTPEDLEHHGGTLELDENGELLLNGDTGISAGIKDELASIKGQPRIIPVFSQVTENGNNAMYTIVEFAGIRIMDVKLTGKKKDKRVIIQPARVVFWGGVPDVGPPTSHFMYSPIILVR